MNNKKIFLPLSAMFLFSLNVFAENIKKELLISIDETSWTPSKKEIKYEVYKVENNKNIEYKFSYNKSGEPIKTILIHESQYTRLRDKMFQIVLETDAKTGYDKKCSPSYKINIETMKEKTLICSGDKKRYFRMQALLSEIHRENYPVLKNTGK